MKLRGFPDSEQPPTAEQVQQEMSARQAEWAVCRYQLGYLGAEPVSMLGHYAGRDQMVFLLATRVPFRRRAIAQKLLARWCEQAAAERPRSLLINCDDGGAPALLYRCIGFTDEVYWHRRYQRPDPTSRGYGDPSRQRGSGVDAERVHHGGGGGGQRAGGCPSQV